MKKDLVDISLTELREFIKNSEELYQIKLSHLSLVAIKLRLQLLISKKQFKSFYSFNIFYLNDENYRTEIHDSILVKSNELFRDAEYWDILLKELIVNENKIHICLFDSGNFYDTTTLLICLERFEIKERVSLTLVSINNNKSIDSILVFNEKDIEIAATNFSALKSDYSIIDYIIKEQENKYVYHITESINERSLSDVTKVNIDFDVVIARNITLNYNFQEHELLFNTYLQLLKSKGLLFVGNKEGFKWCSNFKHLTFQDKTIPIYKKI